MLAERGIGVLHHPLALQEGYGVVGDVERIGDVAQEAAHAAAAPRDPAACSHAHQQGEEHEDAHGVVDAVQAARGAYLPARDEGHQQQCREHEGAPPEASAHRDACPEAAEQQSAEERIEQTHHGYVALLWVNNPAAYHSIGCSRAAGQQTENVEIERQVERQ